MKLYMDSLCDKTSKRELKDALRGLAPLDDNVQEQSHEMKRSTVLNAAYSDVLARIQAQPPGHRALALKVLIWVTFARKQLPVQEFRGAVCTISGDRTFDMDNLRDADTLISRCCGLVILDQESGVVRLIHYTTQDYLEKHQSDWAPTAHQVMASDCLTHLMYDIPGLHEEQLSENQDSEDDDYDDNSSDDSSTLSEQRDLMMDLHEYSAEHWGHHVALSGGHNEQLSEFVEATDKVHHAGIGLWHTLGHVFNSLSRHWPGSVQLSGDDDSPGSVWRDSFTPLHLAAYFGLDDWLHDALKLVQSQPGNSGISTMLRRYQRFGRVLYFTPLDFAILGRHASTVERLAGMGAKLDVGAAHFHSAPLLRASQLGYPDMIDVLIRCGAQVNQRDPTGQTALMIATIVESVDAVSVLLDQGADVLLADSHGWSAPKIAVDQGSINIVAKFLDAGKGVNATDETGWLLLLRAITNGRDRVTMAKFLIASGVDVHRVDDCGRSALARAVRRQCFETVELLIEAGVDVNQKDHRGRTPLMKAVGPIQLDTRQSAQATVQDATQIASLLLLRGAQIEAVDGRGQSALMRAAAKGSPENVKLLIAKGADVNRKDSHGETALMLAAGRQRYSQLSLIRLLLDHGADAQHINDQGQSALMAAASHGQPEVASILMESGADVNGKDANGDTPLMRAAFQAHEYQSVMIRTLLDKGARVGDVNHHGVSALMKAAMAGTTASVELLINAGGDVNEKDSDGETQLMRILGFKDLQMADEDGIMRSFLIKLLLRKGASVHDVDNKGQSPLMIAARSGSYRSAQLLIDAGADLDQKDLNGETPLMMAAPRSAPIVQLLLERGASPQEVDRDGQSALLKALIHHNQESSELIWAALDGKGEHGEALLVQMCQGLVWDPRHILEFLLEHNAVPANAEQYGETCVLGQGCPLHG